MMDKIQIIPNRKYTTKSIKTADGVVHQVYSLGALANAIDRSTHTIRQWEANKIIPKPILSGSLSGNQRFYLKEELRAYIYAVGASGIDRGISAEACGFKKLIRKQVKMVEDEFFNRIEKNIKEQSTREAKSKTVKAEGRRKA